MQFSAVANKHAAFLRLTVDIFKKEEDDETWQGCVYDTVEYIAGCLINGLKFCGESLRSVLTSCICFV